jgi:hypothetical protein
MLARALLKVFARPRRFFLPQMDAAEKVPASS